MKTPKVTICPPAIAYGYTPANALFRPYTINPYRAVNMWQSGEQRAEHLLRLARELAEIHNNT